MRPWVGSAAPLPGDAFATAAATLGVDEAAIRAVWQVESSGRAFRKDGSLERRFEPHHFPRRWHDRIGWHGGGWRDALNVSFGAREEMFAKAASVDMEAACDAASWGGPQIMGFNARMCGFTDSVEMVRQMADSEQAQLDAFTGYIRAADLTTHLAAQDWEAFARGYNGPGQAAVYGRKIESAYRKITGSKSPQIVRVGDSGAKVVKLQQALTEAGHPCAVTGEFDQATLSAVRSFQGAAGLKVDGLVGARTWAALEARVGTTAKAQEDRFDKGLKRVRDAAATAGTVGAATGGFWSGLGETERIIIIGGGVGLVLIGAAAAAIYFLRRKRKAA